MFQWQSARRTSGEKEGTWQEKVLLSIDVGAGDCISSAHPLKSHSQTLSVVCAHVSLTSLYTMVDLSPHQRMRGAGRGRARGGQTRGDIYLV